MTATAEPARSGPLHVHRRAWSRHSGSRQPVVTLARLAASVGVVTGGLGLWAGWAFDGVIAVEFRLTIAALGVASIACAVQRRSGDLVSHCLLLAGLSVSSISGAAAIRDAFGIGHDGPIVLATLVAAPIGYLIAGRTGRPRRRDATTYAILSMTAVGILGVFVLPDVWQIAAAAAAVAAGAAASLASRPLANSALVAATVHFAFAALLVVG
jgi:hypothetical protein